MIRVQSRSEVFTGIACTLIRMNREHRMAQVPQKNSLRDIDDLDELLSEPTEAVVRTLGALDGDIVILGVGGKMGPTLARMAKRASEIAKVPRRVIGVSRFSSAKLESKLHAWGVETVRYDLLEPKSLSALPGAPNVAFMDRIEFGTAVEQSV